MTTEARQVLHDHGIPDDAFNDAGMDFALLQGIWTEEQYLQLTDYATKLIEFADGSIEVLPMPTDTHQTLRAR